MGKELDWVGLKGELVEVRFNTDDRVVLKALSGAYFSVKMKDVYVRNDGGVLIRRTAKLRREGEYEI